MQAPDFAVVTGLLDRLEIPWHITAGLALHMYGLKDSFTDIDIRVYCDDLQALYSACAAEFGAQARLRPPLPFQHGTYDTLCIELDLSDKYDVYSDMNIVRDGLGVVKFPFTRQIFKQVEHMRFQGATVPVASLAQLLVYYLVLRRDKSDSKMIECIAQHPQFDQYSFEQYLQGFEKKREIMAIYTDILTERLA